VAKAFKLAWSRRNQTKVGLKASDDHGFDALKPKKSDQGGIERKLQPCGLLICVPGRNQTKVGLKGRQDSQRG